MQLLKLTGDSFTTYTPTKLEGHAQGQQTRASPFSLPMWESISTIFSMLLGSMSGEVILFSTARQTPSEVWIPMAVEPSCKQAQLQRRAQRRVTTTEHQHHGAMLIPLYATCRDIVLGARHVIETEKQCAKLSSPAHQTGSATARTGELEGQSPCYFLLISSSGPAALGQIIPSLP